MVVAVFAADVANFFDVFVVKVFSKERISLVISRSEHRRMSVPVSVAVFGVGNE